MIITEAVIKDAQAILNLQKQAYRSEAELYNDFAIPPLLQTLDELKSEFGTKVILKAVLNERIVGSVRGWAQNGTCYIERLIVHPQEQGKGIGTQLMRKIEEAFPQAKRYELFTGHRSEKNIRLYRKLGYREFKQQRIRETLSFTYLEKKK